LVHSKYHGSGIGSRLEEFASKLARNSGIKLLYLDSATDFLVAKTYQKWGWVRVGEIPGYAMNPDASLVATTFFYKQL
jgi:GNAT superfamily N-acetyltransferase